MPRTKTTRNYSGSIFKRKINRNSKQLWVWDARKRYTDKAGKRREKFKRCFSQAEANVALINFQNEITDEERNPPNKTRTFLDLTTYFCKEYLVKAKIIDGRIIEGYRQDVERLKRQVQDFEKFFGACLLSELNYERIRQYKIRTSTSLKNQSYATAPPKPATVNRKLSMLNRILNVGVQLGWLPFNPFRAGKPLIDKRAEFHRTRILTFEEEKRLLDACLTDYEVEAMRAGKSLTMQMPAPGEIIHLIVVIALDTAMRKGEILSLKRKQVDLENLVITLDKSQTKSFRARMIPITDRLKNLLETRFIEFPIKDDREIFGIKECRRSFITACDNAGIKDFRFHDLRHVAISWFDQAGLTEMVKKNIVGHSSGDTHQLYHNPSFDVLRDAREKLNCFRLKIDKQLAENVEKEAA